MKEGSRSVTSPLINPSSAIKPGREHVGLICRALVVVESWSDSCICSYNNGVKYFGQLICKNTSAPLLRCFTSAGRETSLNVLHLLVCVYIESVHSWDQSEVLQKGTETVRYQVDVTPYLPACERTYEVFPGTSRCSQTVLSLLDSFDLEGIRRP